MTVEDLIAELQRLPPSAYVAVWVPSRDDENKLVAATVLRVSYEYGEAHVELDADGESRACVA